MRGLVEALTLGWRMVGRRECGVLRGRRTVRMTGCDGRSVVWLWGGLGG
jgi:hypothetical protein